MRQNIRLSITWQVAVVIALVAAIAACSPAVHLTASPSASPTQPTTGGAQASPVSPVVKSSVTVMVTPTPATSTPGAMESLTPPVGALNFKNPPIAILAKNLANPDDLEHSQDKSLYISDISRGTVEKLAGDGSLQVIARGLSIPEGIVLLPGGVLIIAEQGKNRLEKLDLATKALSTFLNLSNTTHQEGVDGLALDASNLAQESIIIPDSPNGVLRRAGLAGGSSTVVATGFTRPTGAWVEPDGNILVVDEVSGYLVRVRPNGTKEKLARFSIPDDVIEDGAGNIYVATLGDHAVHVFTAQGEDIVLTSSISSPQGLAFMPDGNLVVSDPVNHRLIEILIHSQS